MSFFRASLNTSVSFNFSESLCLTASIIFLFLYNLSPSRHLYENASSFFPPLEETMRPRGEDGLVKGGKK